MRKNYEIHFIQRISSYKGFFFFIFIFSRATCSSCSFLLLLIFLWGFFLWVWAERETYTGLPPIFFFVMEKKLLSKRMHIRVRIWEKQSRRWKIIAKGGALSPKQMNKRNFFLNIFGWKNLMIEKLRNFVPRLYYEMKNSMILVIFVFLPWKLDSTLLLSYPYKITVNRIWVRTASILFLEQHKLLLMPVQFRTWHSIHLFECGWFPLICSCNIALSS